VGGLETAHQQQNNIWSLTVSDQTNTLVTSENEKSPFSIYTLRIEDPERADKFVNDVIALLNPEDVVALEFARQYTRNAWIVERYDRAEALAVERRVQQSREFQAQRAKEVKRRHESRIAELSASAGEGPADIARPVALDRNIDAAADDVDAILNRPAQDAEYLRAIEKSMETLKNLDFLKGQAIKRRNEAIELLQQWNAGFGNKLREAAKQVLDAKFEEVSQPLPQFEAPLIMITNEANDAHEGEVAGQPQQ
jgi:hypothetical protein